jgi:hypothetical protein
VLLDHYRGRSIYPFPVQAAERSVRKATGLTGIDDLSLEKVERRNGSWEVSFEAGGRSHAVHVDEERGDLTLLTCSSEAPKRPRRYVVSPG